MATRFLRRSLCYPSISLPSLFFFLFFPLPPPHVRWRCRSHSFDAALVSNMLHISAAGTTAGLFRAAAAALRPAGRLLVYGPFRRDGQFTTESNRQFDEKLKQMSVAAKRTQRNGVHGTQSLDAARLARRRAVGGMSARCLLLLLWLLKTALFAMAAPPHSRRRASLSSGTRRSDCETSAR